MGSAQKAMAFLGGDHAEFERVTRVLARAILDLASAGVRDPKLMSDLALRQLPPVPAR